MRSTDVALLSENKKTQFKLKYAIDTKRNLGSVILGR